MFSLSESLFAQAGKMFFSDRGEMKAVSGEKRIVTFL